MLSCTLSVCCSASQGAMNTNAPPPQPAATSLTLSDPPNSGLGDRFSAWLALFTLAKHRNATATLPNASWSPIAHSHQANQNRDMSSALACFVLPPHVRRVERIAKSGVWDDTGTAIEPISLHRFFRPGLVLPHPVPGFPQWALPELASRAFQIVDPRAKGMTLENYLDTMRSVSAEIGVQPACVPPGAHERFPILQSPEVQPPQPQQPPPQWPIGITRRQRHPVRLCLHLRRGDSWTASKPAGSEKGRTTRYVKSLSDHAREKFTNRTRGAILQIIEALDAYAELNTQQLQQLPHHHQPHNQPHLQQSHHLHLTSSSHPASWLIVSDDVEQADYYRRLITTTSRTGQTAYVPPDGYAVYSFLAMRHVHGIIQSTMRLWSSFSSVPAIMGAVPLLSIDSGRWGVIPHVSVCSTVEQYSLVAGTGLGGAGAFAARVIRGVKNCTDPVVVRRRPEKKPIAAAAAAAAAASMSAIPVAAGARAIAPTAAEAAPATEAAARRGFVDSTSTVGEDASTPPLPETLANGAHPTIDVSIRGLQHRLAEKDATLAQRDREIAELVRRSKAAKERIKDQLRIAEQDRTTAELIAASKERRKKAEQPDTRQDQAPVLEVGKTVLRTPACDALIDLLPHRSTCNQFNRRPRHECEKHRVGFTPCSVVAVPAGGAQLGNGAASRHPSRAPPLVNTMCLPFGECVPGKGLKG